MATHTDTETVTGYDGLDAPAFVEDASMDRSTPEPPAIPAPARGALAHTAQRLSDSYIHASGSSNPFKRGARGALRLARRGILKAADPIVEYQLGPAQLALPLSHDLPYIRAWATRYGDNFVRIVAELNRQEGAAPIIDVGANVGDTVALVREVGAHPVLCVEGSSEYLPLLRANVAPLGDVEIEPVFVGPATLSGSYALHALQGTAELRITGPEQDGATIVPVDGILERHPRFAHTRLLKVDTDGFDALVLRSAESLLRQSHPVLFFEYFPDLAPDPDELPEVFSYLAGLGYRKGLIYDATGDFLVGANLDDAEFMADIHSRYRGNPAMRYADICAVHEADESIAQALRITERQLAESRVAPPSD
jgi:FkbM family methyltransferase